MDENFLSVTLDSEKCKGCINCLKHCPTQAIRVRDGKALILKDRCIDCGECIRMCQNHAKSAVYDPLSVLSRYKYTVALPAPSLYGQFANMEDVEIILNGLLRIGFDDVFEVAKAAEVVSHCTRELVESGKPVRPIISSACPVVVRLIRIRYPELLSHLLPLGAPVDVAAKLAEDRALKLTGLSREDIGIVFITPCAAKVSAIKEPCARQKSSVDAVVAIKDVYPRLLGAMREVCAGKDRKELALSGNLGISWCGTGGEASALFGDNYLAADGIRGIVSVLEDLEDEKITNIDFIELNACNGGCVGGILTVENPYLALARIKKLKKTMPPFRNDDAAHSEANVRHWDSPIRYDPALALDSDPERALEKLRELHRILDLLPGLDCGSCGAPTCAALAEDVVCGTAKSTDCIFRMRDYVHNLVREMPELDEYIPPPFRDPGNR